MEVFEENSSVPGEPPVDGAIESIAVRFPGADFDGQHLCVGDATVEAPAPQAAG